MPVLFFSLRNSVVAGSILSTLTMQALGFGEHVREEKT